MSSRLLRLLNVGRRKEWKLFHTTSNLSVFHEYDKKSLYPRISDYKEEPKNPYQRMKEGYSMLKTELGMLKEEFMEKIRMDPTVMFRIGEVDLKWKFDGNPKTLLKWVVTNDSDFNDGYSKSTLQLTPTGTGLFSGILDTKVPKDGKKASAGYCNIRSTQQRKAFARAEAMDWGMYTHLILRIRGDGRSYMINLTLNNDYDIMWNDIHTFPLYTRGGPYWQYVKIPFSKFYLSNRGRVQDSQCPIRLNMVNHFGITCGDGITGPFSLEIDYIGLERDLRFTEEFAYEMYRPPNPYYV